MSSGRGLLAAYLDQRRRMGEPGIVPASIAPRRLAELARAAGRDLGGQRSRAGARPGSPASPPGRPLLAHRPRVAARTVAARADAPSIEKLGYDELREVALGCTRCRLADKRKKVAFADGNPKGRLMVVGEAPGAQEDATGLPFVGQAGKLLDLMLASVGLSRKDSVYICNVLKCRPPGNRNPQPDEIEACAGFLKRQIELVAPEAVLAVGTFAAKWLTSSKKSLGRLRGEVHSYQGAPLVVTYHPAALLRNPGWNRPAWDDLQLLRQVMER